ncbi:MAG: CotH kinase family protein [Crocinitomix sp.]|nr:CotH kinase family protein [Crocinitomix sp.]
MIKKYILSIVLITANLTLMAQALAPPTPSIEAGIYTSAVELELTHLEAGVSIFYTLNGEVPSVSDILYSGPITLDNIDGEDDVFSIIPTNPNLTYPFGTYSAGRASSRGWVPPYTDSYKANVVRYKAFKPGFAPSPTVTQTFIIDPSGTGLYTMPIVSIAMDYTNIFSDEEGIYVYGDHEDGNYEQKGAAWEKIMSFEYIDENGDIAVSQDSRTRIHGGGSRHAPKKSFRIYGETDSVKNFRYPFFEDSEIDKYKRILLKAGGHRPDCFPRDDLGNMLTKGVNVEQQHYRHVIVFINGEYWGIHSIKERMDNYFIQNLYGIDDNDITMLDQEYDIQGDGHEEDSAKMKNLEGFVDVNDMNDPTNYAYVLDRMDVDNYIDYMASEIFLSNEDWVYSNVNIWRKNGEFDPSKPAGHDGKFRWAIYDLDGAFGGSCANAFYTVNTLASATIIGGEFSSYSRFFRGMLGSDEFKHKYINRMNDLANSWFSQSEMDHKMDSMYTMLTPEVLENANRWRYPSFASNLEDRYDEVPGIERWNELWDLLHLFAERRGRKVREHMMEKWDYPNDTTTVTIDVNDVNMGRVKVNSILINRNLPGVTDEMYPWNGVYINTVSVPLIAVPLPGYRFIEWLETGETNDTIEWIPSTEVTYTAVFGVDEDYQSVLINELMPSNANYSEDNFGQNDDWLELYNPNPYPVNLSGCKLRRDGINWTLPNEFIIPANHYLMFWHDNETYQGTNHVGFKLSNIVDTVFLISPQGEEMDYMRYPETPTDNSYGRYPNGSETFSSFTYPTPLANNDISGLNEDVTILTPLSAYPNPANEIVMLNKKVDFVLYDLKGSLVLEGINQQKFNVSHLKKGAYILRTDELETIKIIVQ